MLLERQTTNENIKDSLLRTNDGHVQYVDNSHGFDYSKDITYEEWLKLKEEHKDTDTNPWNILF